MKKVILVLIVLSMALSLVAQATKGKQDIDDLFKEEEKPKVAPQDDLIKINYEKRDARRAMLYSMLVPGLGQYYADKSAITTYIFPAIELMLIGGIVYYNSKGNSQVDDYEKYATGETITMNIGGYEYTGKRYDRNFQLAVQNIVIAHNPDDIYNSDFFRLDSSFTQHFYEDIGKYNKYIFGWADWYHSFATDSNGNFVLDQPEYSGVWIWTDGQPHEIRWQANYRIADFITGNPSIQPISPNLPIASPMRNKYIQMRKDAEKEYGKARILSFMMAINHITSGLDAISVTNKRNRYYLSDSGLHFQYYTDLRQQTFTPALSVSYKF